MGFAHDAHWTFSLILLASALCAVDCRDRSDHYVAAAAISKNGFARTARDLRQWEGQKIWLWGFVDHGNLYGDDDARRILADHWSGPGPSPDTWRFNLKASADDPVGRSFSVYVRNDAGRDRILAAFLADARAHRPTQVFGRLFSFEAPTNVQTHSGLYVEVQSSQHIRFDAPEH